MKGSGPSEKWAQNTKRRRMHIWTIKNFVNIGQGPQNYP
jgi:hypothetical protein